ncbi:MAG: LysM peptidoglycan-binding domain-containing protein [Pseudomonadota bacterium]
MTSTRLRGPARFLVLSAVLLSLVACNQPLDFDLRGNNGGFSTATAATRAQTGERPVPDDRGIISYPSYQVVVAERGDTISGMATRLGLNASELAQFNGIEQDVPLRKGEVIALPARVAEPSTPTGSAAASTGNVDIDAIAGGAINRVSPLSDGVQTAALSSPASNTPLISNKEPIRHKVERGETAYTIARLYQVPVKSLAEWNGLGSDFAIREGQFLLIPVAQSIVAAAPAPVTAPGAGSPTPSPPSAATPLPEPEEPAVVPTPEPVDVGEANVPASSAAMVFPVDGSVIRTYAKGRNEGIDIKADPGAPVRAADAGTVAAITKSAEGVPIIVVRHDAELLTVYANVTDVSVEKGAAVARGENIAKLRSGDDAYVHFEVRQGFDSIDPITYLE